MGSLNDYNNRFRDSFRKDSFRDLYGDSSRSRSFWRRLAWQSLFSVIFFFLVATLINADNVFGIGARYIAASGVSATNSWIDWSGQGSTLPVDADQQEDNSSLPVSGNATNAQDTTDTTQDSGNATATSEGDIPSFTAPASGVVVTDLAVAVSGFSTQLGITISGSEGQNVKASAAGAVAYLGSSEDGYIVELVHSGGFSSVYQGLSEICVAMGDEVSAAQVIGNTASGQMTFSLLCDGSEVDPLEYLFR